jgi:two-component system response regulator MprA
MTMARVLVVDDSRQMRANLRMILGNAGHDVVLATTGREALDLVREAPPDAVVIDTVLPADDGVATLRALRAGNPDLPILLLLGLAPLGHLEAALAAGASAYQWKAPLDRDALLAWIAKATGQA